MTPNPIKNSPNEESKATPIRRIIPITKNM